MFYNKIKLRRRVNIVKFHILEIRYFRKITIKKKNSLDSRGSNTSLVGQDT